MAKIQLKEIALSMRKKGRGIKEISRELGISSSTASYWCRDIALSAKDIELLSKRSKKSGTAGLLRYSEKTRLKRQLAVQHAHTHGARLAKKLSERDMIMLGLGLYWGEGYKRGSEEFGFTNSDADMLVFYIQWLETLFSVKKDNLILRVSINGAHTHRDKAIRAFWSKKLGVSVTQFTKTSFINTESKKAFSRNAKYYGTLRIKVRRGTMFRRQVLGALEQIKKKI